MNTNHLHSPAELSGVERFEVRFFMPSETGNSGSYLFLLKPNREEARLVAFTPAQLVSVHAFNQRLDAVVPGTQWTGNGRLLDRLMQHQISKIETINAITL